MTWKSGPARHGHATQWLEGDNPMQDTDAQPRRDDAKTTSAEASMRLALERLSTRSSPVHRAAGGRASDAATDAAAIRRTSSPNVRYAPHLSRPGASASFSEVDTATRARV